jgi:hypothetical protein
VSNTRTGVIDTNASAAAEGATAGDGRPEAACTAVDTPAIVAKAAITVIAVLLRMLLLHTRPVFHSFGWRQFGLEQLKRKPARERRSFLISRGVTLHSSIQPTANVPE